MASAEANRCPVAALGGGGRHTSYAPTGRTSLLAILKDLPCLLPALWLTTIYALTPLCIALEAYMAFQTPALLVALCVWWLYITLGPGRHTPGAGTWPAFLRGQRILRGLKDYFPARLVKTAELPPDGRYLLALHPHGVACCSMFVGFASGALGFHRVFPGLDLRPTTLSMHFCVPIAREYLLSHGYADVSSSSCRRLLSKPGTALVIAVGGGAEAAVAKPGSMDLVLLRRKGFVRVALQTGAALVPVLAFGENELLHVIPTPPGSLLGRLSKLTRRFGGFTLPLAYGQGVMGIRFGPWPVRRPLNIVVGAPLQLPRFVGDLRSKEGQELVDEWHAKYVAALQQLWEAHREAYGEAGAELKLVE